MISPSVPKQPLVLQPDPNPKIGESMGVYLGSAEKPMRSPHQQYGVWLGRDHIGDICANQMRFTENELRSDIQALIDLWRARHPDNL